MSKLIPHIDCLRVLAQSEYNRYCNEIRTMTKREEKLVDALKEIVRLNIEVVNPYSPYNIARRALEEL